MRKHDIPEKTFLKRFLLNQFNIQRGQSFKADDFDIRSVPAMFGYRLGYEVKPVRINSTMRILAYLSVARSDTLGPFILQVKEPNVVNALGDEVFVVKGSIDSAHHLYGGYQFAHLDYDDSLLPIIVQSDGSPLLLAGGGYLLLS